MTCEEFAEVAAAYVLGALEPAEMDACDAHLAAHGEDAPCRRALRDAQATAAAMDAALPEVAPDAAVWRRISAAVVREPPVSAARPGPRPQVRWTGRLVTVAALAAALILWLGFRDAEQRLKETQAQVTAAHHSAAERQAAIAAASDARKACESALKSLGDDDALAQKALALLQSPGARLVPLKAPAGTGPDATAIVDVKAGRAFILSHALRPRPGKDYALWVIKGKGAPVPAGLMRALANGVVLGEVDASVLARGAPDALAVSVEKTGGNPTPTEVILVGALKG